MLYYKMNGQQQAGGFLPQAFRSIFFGTSRENIHGDRGW